MGNINKSQGVEGLTPISIGDPDKIPEGYWPFPEQEKKGSWDEEKEAKERAAADAELAKIRGAKWSPVAAAEMAKPSHNRDEELIKALQRNAEIEREMSPPGALGLTPKLEAARLRWKIGDKAFQRQAQFRRIHIFQVDLMALLGTGEDRYYPGTTIERPTVAKRVDQEGCHMGILISAGLTALDELCSHGTELGNVVGFIRNAPMRHTFSRSENGESYYLVLNSGDITCDETLGQELIRKERFIEDQGGDKGYCHVIAGAKRPSDVFISRHW